VPRGKGVLVNGYEFFIDPSRCIGCKACMQACMECDTHRGRSMIHLEFVDRAASTQTSPVVCMHCEDPTCARVCPADAIKQTEHGIVHSSLKPRCIGCSNCVIACPFGVPHYVAEIDQMMKCDMCFDRTSVGKKPMCATVCPSQALYYGTAEDIERMRVEKPINEFRFGMQTVRTKVRLMSSPETDQLDFDVMSFMPGDDQVPDITELVVWGN
jgi:Fe-S-cluster-containing dehydrogenase component